MTFRIDLFYIVIGFIPLIVTACYKCIEKMDTKLRNYEQSVLQLRMRVSNRDERIANLEEHNQRLNTEIYTMGRTPPDNDSYSDLFKSLCNLEKNNKINEETKTVLNKWRKKHIKNRPEFISNNMYAHAILRGTNGD